MRISVVQNLSLVEVGLLDDDSQELYHKRLAQLQQRILPFVTLVQILVASLDTSKFTYVKFVDSIANTNIEL